MQRNRGKGPRRLRMRRGPLHLHEGDLRDLLPGEEELEHITEGDGDTGMSTYMGQPSFLATDGYKLSMAEAGWPLRRETFYYTHRKGGAHVLPVHAESFVRDLFPGEPRPCDLDFLDENKYGLSGGTLEALRLRSQVEVVSIPQMGVFQDYEPAFSVTAPSALVSWLEPLLLQLNYRIQVATMAFGDPEILKSEVALVTCERQKEIVLETAEYVGMTLKESDVRVDSGRYFEEVTKTVKELLEIVGDPARIFEVGLRSATCLEQHQIVLEACAALGVKRTSNVLGAWRLGLKAVGTMGHEHVQRYGSDEAAFRGMKDRRPHRSSYLLDTTDTFLSGIPTAFRIMAETDNSDSIRYDSGDKIAQYCYAVARAKEFGVDPVHIIEDSMDSDMTYRLEVLRRQLGVKESKQFYGYGGFIVNQPSFGRLSRDRVSAVWKLCQTGPRATMKFSGASGGGRGKESVPGKPVIFRRGSGSGPHGIIGQQGETCPPGYVLISTADGKPDRPWPLPSREFDTSIYSAQTEALRLGIRGRKIQV